MTANSQYKALCQGDRSQKKPTFCFAHISNQEPGLHVARGPVNTWPTPVPGLPPITRQSPSRRLFPAHTYTSQPWAVCMCERHGYVVRKHGCCPVVLSLCGDWSVASPLPRALGPTCCLTPHASHAVSSCRLVSTLGLL